MSHLVLFTDASWISPYVFSCFVALKEKGLEFEAHPVSLDRNEHLAAPYRDSTLTARVPALRHDDFWLAESAAIVEYLDDAFPGASPALPTGVRERARARQVLGWIRSDLLALREERPTTTMFYQPASVPLTPAGIDAAAKLVRVGAELVREGASTIFEGGFTIADADLAFMLHRLILNGHDVPTRLRKFAEEVWARPSVRAFVERERPPMP